MDVVHAQLQKVFGHHDFQEGQEGIIRDILEGNDVLGVLPTGSGKSLCYQLPAIILPGLTIVISPLISLMIDQVRQIKAYYFKEVAALHSFQPLYDRKAMLANLSKYKLLFLSPELLQQHEVISQLKKINISLFCIDEAHCISQWGYDFRPDYLRIHPVIQELSNPPVLALTGTATENIQSDIISHLHCPAMKKHVYTIEKKNITFVVEKLTCQELEKKQKLADYANKLKKPALIYFSSRKKTEEMAAYLTKLDNAGRVAYYHAGMQGEDRLKVQEQFIHDQLDIICCTSAFGMGINKGNIRTVIHYHPPAQLESFLQEVGRAGRDGKDCLSLLLYKGSDMNVPLSMIENELPEKHELEFVFRRLRDLQIKGESLPASKDSLQLLFQLPETKWRLLQYQLELHQIIYKDILPFNQDKWETAYENIHQFCISRREYKRRKVNEMIHWLQSKSCLRQSLYASFQEDVHPKLTKCCSNCGWDEKDFQHNDKKKESKEENTWQSKLKRILLVEENEHAKSE